MMSSPEQEYSDDGVDITLIRWMLSLTPEERLRLAEEWAAELYELQASYTAAIHPPGE